MKIMNINPNNNFNAKLSRGLINEIKKSPYKNELNKVVSDLKEVFPSETIYTTKTSFKLDLNDKDTFEIPRRLDETTKKPLPLEIFDLKQLYNTLAYIEEGIIR